LPQLKNASSMWWGRLVSEAFYAPVYLGAMYIVIHAINARGFNAGFGPPGQGQDFFAMFTGSSSSSVTVLINFGLVIGLMMGAMVVARSIGSSGGRAANTFAGTLSFGAAGWIGRNTAGRLASRAADSNLMNRIGSGTIGSIGLKGLRGVAGSSFDARRTALGKSFGTTVGGTGKASGEGGYSKQLKRQIEDREKYAHSLVIRDKDGRVDKAESARLRQQYAEDLNTGSVDTLWMKVARKDKLAALRIGDQAKKEAEQAQNEKDKKEIKKNQSRLEEVTPELKERTTALEKQLDEVTKYLSKEDLEKNLEKVDADLAKLDAALEKPGLSTAAATAVAVSQGPERQKLIAERRKTQKTLDEIAAGPLKSKEEVEKERANITKELEAAKQELQGDNPITPEGKERKELEEKIKRAKGEIEKDKTRQVVKEVQAETAAAQKEEKEERKVEKAEGGAPKAPGGGAETKGPKAA
jgi:hypothetical protein